MGVPSDEILAEQKSTDFSARKRLEANRNRERRRKREEALIEEGSLRHNR